MCTHVCIIWICYICAYVYVYIHTFIYVCIEYVCKYYMQIYKMMGLFITICWTRVLNDLILDSDVLAHQVKHPRANASIPNHSQCSNPLPIQISVTTPEKAAEDSPSAGVPTTHLGDPHDS